ncbi:MAG: hypothetical protein HYR96_12250 [Deltaproteobacteria bacterium]|nr:hypothetical protein [Deltaproteobacteria bacterium]MBI3296026.1 hypothetical protein [Deltaproteobacteria bacterium]
MKRTLWIIGTPLDDTGTLPAAAVEAIAGCALIVGETRKATMRLLAHSGLRLPEDRFLFLDHEPPKKEIVSQLKGATGNVALLSDTGMPILFDPGADVLEAARAIGFAIRTLPAATSWGTACALSGFAPPFLIHGFLPQKAPDRLAALQNIKPLKLNVVLLDTPYRFQTLLEESIKVFGGKQEAFLAWEIARAGEWYGWGTVNELAKAPLPKKGEFILILKRLT